MASRPQVFRIHHGDYAAEISARGAGLKALTFRGEPLVETYRDTPPLSAGLVLAPWPNRTSEGRFTWAGVEHRLPVNEPERNNAIHGLVHEVDWAPEASAAVRGSVASATAALRLTTTLPSPWPWTVHLSATYLLDEQGLLARFEATAPETPLGPSPFAFGLHTYLSARGADTNDCVLSIPVTEHHLLDERNLPSGEVLPARLERQPLSEVVWDDCFRGDGPLVADYVHAATGKGVRMSMGKGLEWVQLFTPNDFPGRGRALAVEPMSAPPNALRSGEDLATVFANRPIAYELRLSAI